MKAKRILKSSTAAKVPKKKGREPRVHLADQFHARMEEAWPTACNSRPKHQRYCTFDRTKVTCKLCRRTKKFREKTCLFCGGVIEPGYRLSTSRVDGKRSMIWVHTQDCVECGESIPNVGEVERALASLRNRKEVWRPLP